MRVWLLVLAVLATIFMVTHVAGTEDVSSSSTTTQKPTHKDSYTIDSTSDREYTRFLYEISSDTDIINNFVADKNSDINVEKKKPQQQQQKQEANATIDNATTVNDTIGNENATNTTTETKPKASPEQLVELENNLLTLFGLKKRPKVDRSKIVIPESIIQAYNIIEGLELATSPHFSEETDRFTTIRLLTHEESEIDKRFQDHHRNRLYFNVADLPQEEKLVKAVLTLDRLPHETVDKIRHHLQAQDIIRPGLKTATQPLFKHIDSTALRITDNGTVELDITDAVARWRAVPQQNHGLLLHVFTEALNISDVPEHRHVRIRRDTESDAEWSAVQPTLLVYMDDGRKKVKRDTRRAMKGKGKGRSRVGCQRHPLYVDFSDVGWSDWIVAPPGYDANYCSGECNFPIADHLNTTNHAIVQTLVNSISPNSVPKACCVPVNLSSICMLYVDDQNKVVLKNYQDMTVVGCGCR